jgi:methylated-DNA-[protein]-cysteine S-methyltransferase
MNLEISRLSTPIGTLTIATDGPTLHALAFEGEEAELRAHLARRYPGVPLRDSRGPHAVAVRLAAYFEGDLTALESIPVETGGTPFQRSVWTALRQLRPGQTVSYHALAGRIGRPKAVRAVGAANGANPVAIVIPCHRVIGADGGLTGYGGGLHRKSWLLDHEAAAVSAAPKKSSSSRTSS